MVLLAVMSLLGMDGCGNPEPRSVPDPLVREEGEFSSTTELLEAIEDGTFAERVGLAEELAAAMLPSPVEIEFVRGTAVPGDQEPELRELAARLQSNERVKLQIVGCSDPSGPEVLNQRISERRAQSVASQLSDLGVPSAQINDVAGRGEACDPPERVVHVIPSLQEEEEPAASGDSGGS